MVIWGIKSIALISFLVSLIGFYIYLSISQRFNIKRAVREETGERHAAKSHIPDMGGVVMLTVYAILFPLYSMNFPESYFKWWGHHFWLLYWTPLALGVLGLMDDVMKSRGKSTRGLRAAIRFPLQVLVVVIVTFVLKKYMHGVSTVFLLWLIIFFLATINASNFTDGLDGLLSGCSLISIFGLIGFCAKNSLSISWWKHDEIITVNPLIMYSVIPVSIIVAFMFFNTYPARMFMGDSGSMFIGSFLALLPILADATLPFVLIAFMIYLALISVVIQVISFKLTKKRVFPMTPFHHSFEKWGWHENHIVWFYYAFSVAFALITIFYWKNIYAMFAG